MVTSHQSPISAGKELLRILEGLEQSQGEGLTTNVAEVLLEKGLGLTRQQYLPQYLCGTKRKVDFAASYINEEFDLNREYPNILLELKKPDYNLDRDSGAYFKAVSQLKAYMRSQNCTSVEHGIVFNICQLQMFRKHRNLIYPITDVIDFKDIINDKSKTHDTKINDIDKIITHFRKNSVEEFKGHNNSRGTIITVWNNKGGVGKTTVAFFLSCLLSDPDNYKKSKGKRCKILAIDYDHNQGDLTKNFKCKIDENREKTFSLLKSIKEGSFDQSILEQSIVSVPIDNDKNISVDLLAADKYLSEAEEIDHTYSVHFPKHEGSILRKSCLELAKSYDYVIIDAPPNYEQSIYAREAIDAADCLLPIAEWGGKNSFENYYHFVCDLLPKIRCNRKDGGPENLGLWINKYNQRNFMTVKDQTIKHIMNLIDSTKQEKQEELRQAFFRDGENLRIISESAYIRKANYFDSPQRFKVPWYAKPKGSYTDLLKEIIGERR